LLSGVTNSGKSTLIAALIALSKELYPGRSHHTLEDPPEFDLGVVQTHVTPEQKVSEESDEYRDYAYYSKVLLRQDPDVISIGEVRDRAVAMQS
ncbi:ATPase, T2SS/T4P/T4SS family, partial [Photobacterium damselae]